jgi:hypothetical protein
MPSFFGSASSNKAALLGALLLGACGGGPAAVTDSRAVALDAATDDGGGTQLAKEDAPPGRVCTSALPAECPDGGAPSYAAVIAPIVASRCLPACHEPGGASGNKPLTTRALIKSRLPTVLTQIYTCRMPPAERPQLPEGEADLLLTWLVCGAPDN